MHDSSDDGAGGHYVTSGATLVALGALALLVSIAIRVNGVELHFIDSRTMALFSAGFIAVGAWMVRHGRKADGPSSLPRGD